MRNFYWVIILFFPVAAFASSGIGDLASNLLEPVYVASSFVNSAAIAVGVCAVFGAILRYMQHRVNPLAAPISTVIILFVLGVVLICLPLMYKLTESGIPYNFPLLKFL